MALSSKPPRKYNTRVVFKEWTEFGEHNERWLYMVALMRVKLLPLWTLSGGGSHYMNWLKKKSLVWVQSHCTCDTRKKRWLNFIFVLLFIFLLLTRGQIQSKSEKSTDLVHSSQPPGAELEKVGMWIWKNKWKSYCIPFLLFFPWHMSFFEEKCMSQV